jgi:hypothetical protein
MMLALEAVIVSYWVRTSEHGANRGRVRIGLRTPSGKEFGHETADYEVDLSQSSRVRMFGKIGGIPIDGLGVYQLFVRCQREGETDWVDVGHYPLLVRAQTA